MDYVDSVAKRWTCPVCTESCGCARCEINLQENSSELTRNNKKRMAGKGKSKMKVSTESKRQANPIIKSRGESKKFKSSDSDSGSLYIPASERQKKKTSTFEDNLNKKTRNSLRKNNKMNNDSNPRSYLEEKKEKLRKLELKENMVAGSSQTNVMQQNYPQAYTAPINTQLPMQYLPYQYSYILPQLPQAYSSMLSQPVYTPIPYYNPQVYSEYINGGANQIYQEEYNRGFSAWHK
jgi:hypothetical protein